MGPTFISSWELCDSVTATWSVNQSSCNTFNVNKLIHQLIIVSQCWLNVYILKSTPTEQNELTCNVFIVFYRNKASTRFRLCRKRNPSWTCYYVYIVPGSRLTLDILICRDQRLVVTTLTRHNENKLSLEQIAEKDQVELNIFVRYYNEQR